MPDAVEANATARRLRGNVDQRPAIQAERGSITGSLGPIEALKEMGLGLMLVVAGYEQDAKARVDEFDRFGLVALVPCCGGCDRHTGHQGGRYQGDSGQADHERTI